MIKSKIDNSSSTVVCILYVNIVGQYDETDALKTIKLRMVGLSQINSW